MLFLVPDEFEISGKANSFLIVENNSLLYTVYSKWNKNWSHVTWVALVVETLRNTWKYGVFVFEITAILRNCCHKIWKLEYFHVWHSLNERVKVQKRSSGEGANLNGFMILKKCENQIQNLKNYESVSSKSDWRTSSQFIGIGINLNCIMSSCENIREYSEIFLCSLPPS